MAETTTRYFSRQDLDPSSEIDEEVALELPSYALVSMVGDRISHHECWADSTLWSVRYFDVEDQGQAFAAHSLKYPGTPCDFIKFIDDSGGYRWEILDRWETNEGSSHHTITLIDCAGHPIGEWMLDEGYELRETQKHSWMESGMRFTFQYSELGEQASGFDHLEGDSVRLDAVQPTEPDGGFWQDGFALPRDMGNPSFPLQTLEATRKRLSSS